MLMQSDDKQPPRRGILPIVTQDQRDLNKLAMVFQTMQEIDEAMPIQVALTFLMVAMNEGCSMTDIWKHTGWAQSTVSRHLLDLGPKDRHHKPGFGLITFEKDPMELRKNIYKLTPRGRALAGKLLNIVRM